VVLDGYHLQHHYAKTVCFSYVHIGWIPPSVAPYYVFMFNRLFFNWFNIFPVISSVHQVGVLPKYLITCRVKLWQEESLCLTVCPVKLWQEAVSCLECQVIWGHTVSRSSLSYNFCLMSPDSLSWNVCFFVCFCFTFPVGLASSSSFQFASFLESWLWGHWASKKTSQRMCRIVYQ